MSKNFTRREFLRTTGAAVLAVAAAGALSACGGSGGSGSSDASLARTLGDLTFNIVDFDYPGEYGGMTADGQSNEEYRQYYSPILSVKNNSTAPISMDKVTFSMTLEGVDSPLNYTNDKKCLFSEHNDKPEFKTLTVAPGEDKSGYLGYVRTTTTEETYKIAYLTITYGGKKVIYKLDGQVFSASGVTNA